MKKAVFLFLAMLTVALSGCQTVDDDRIPYAPVRIAYTTSSMWEQWGVNGALDAVTFIKDDNLPVGFPYTGMSYTGFGGVLLCGDIHGEPVAYDMACPVERQRNVRILIDVDKANAYCPKCQSVYDVFANFGAPISGEAAQKGFGLRRYRVTSGAQGEYRVIIN